MYSRRPGRLYALYRYSVMPRTALITGASRGIGRAIAVKLASEGYQVIITCLKNDRLLEETRNIIEQTYGVTCFPFVGDMGDAETVGNLFCEITSRFQTLDVVVNNAGISYVGLFTDLSPAEWNRILQTNLSSAVYCSQKAIPLMLSNKRGKIINISSVWGCVGASCEAAYSAVKGGLNSLTMALAKELAPSNIQVNAIACGAIDTEMNQFLSQEERAALIEEIPADRFGKPEEVADLVYDLCQSHSYLTGQVIKFDGGWI